MRLFIFKSDASIGLRAFAADESGQGLPDQFRPWHAVGVVREGAPPPHDLSRDVIEAAINDVGYQLWRLKDSKAAVRKRGRKASGDAAAG